MDHAVELRLVGDRLERVPSCRKLRRAASCDEHREREHRHGGGGYSSSINEKRSFFGSSGFFWPGAAG